METLLSWQKGVKNILNNFNEEEAPKPNVQLLFWMFFLSFFLSCETLKTEQYFSIYIMMTLIAGDRASEILMRLFVNIVFSLVLHDFERKRTLREWHRHEHIILISFLNFWKMSMTVWSTGKMSRQTRDRTISIQKWNRMWMLVWECLLWWILLL